MDETTPMEMDHIRGDTRKNGSKGRTKDSEGRPKRKDKGKTKTQWEKRRRGERGHGKKARALRTAAAHKHVFVEIALNRASMQRSVGPQNEKPRAKLMSRPRVKFINGDNQDGLLGDASENQFCGHFKKYPELKVGAASVLKPRTSSGCWPSPKLSRNRARHFFEDSAFANQPWPALPNSAPQPPAHLEFGPCTSWGQVSI